MWKFAPHILPTPVSAQRLPGRIQPLVVQGDESGEVSLAGHRLRLLYRPWEQKVHTLEWKDGPVWVGAWCATAGLLQLIDSCPVDWTLWNNLIHCAFQTVLVHTPETICLTYFMDLLLQRGKPIMLVGNAGVGKTILVSDKVAKLKEDYMVAKVPFNYYTTSAMLQRKNPPSSFSRFFFFGFSESFLVIMKVNWVFFYFVSAFL